MDHLNIPEYWSIRLKGYDYSQPGFYFVTLCTNYKQHLFGKVDNNVMLLNENGLILEDCITQIPLHFPNAKVDYYCIMPNHSHLIVIIENYRIPPNQSTPSKHERKPIAGSLSTIIRSLKSATTKGINTLRQTPGATVWQINFFEHIIRDDIELYRIRKYIENNPLKWNKDMYNNP